MQPVAVAMVMLMTFGITLNPDGSGKAVVEITQTPRPGPRAAEAPETVKEFAQRMIRQKEGVDTWSDVAVGTRPKDSLLSRGLCTSRIWAN